jgi:hypothetical protein
MGRGIVHPTDEMNARNAPSHPELLDWLSRDFAASGFDIRRLVRGIVLSRPYALNSSSGPPEAFAGAIERPLTGEQLARSWRVACGLPPEEDGLRHAVVSVLPEVLPKDYNVSFQQAQFLAGSSVLTGLLQDPSGTNLVRLNSLPEAGARVTEAFSTVYGRPPAPLETEQAMAFLNQGEGVSAEKTRDLLWALMTSAEFLTQP